MKISNLKLPVITGLLLLGAAAWKAVFLVWDRFPFNSDEAIVGLMARHILNGARPVFFYGQSYMGSLDAWLTAGGFAVFGQQVWVIRLVQGLLYLATVSLTMLMVWRISASRVAVLVTGLLLAFPTVNVLLYTTVSLGGYNEALLFGSLTLLLSVEQHIQQQHTGRISIWLFAAWGLAAGLGVWANYLTLVYILPGAVFELWLLYKGGQTSRTRPAIHLLVAALGVVTGSIPLWTAAFQQGVGEFFNATLRFGFSANGAGIWLTAAEHVRNFLLFGIPVLIGIRPPWEFSWLALPLIPFVLAIWGWFLLKGLRGLARRGGSSPIRFLLWGTTLAFLLAFCFSYFGADPSGRYFLPMYVLAAVGMGLYFSLPRRKLELAAVGIIVMFHVVTTFQCAVKTSPGFTTQFTDASRIDHRYDDDLIRFLENEGELLGYSNYWVTYPLAFLTGEQILFVPALPYEMKLGYNQRDDRYPQYTGLVRQADHPAYIITRQPGLDFTLRAAFEQQGITWLEKTIGDYHIFYQLSKNVHPADLGLVFSAD